MIDIKHLDDTTELDQPRRIRKYVLVCCSSGSAVLVVDENEFVLKANSVITITSGQIHYIKTKKAPKGFVLEFTYDFFCKNDADIELILVEINRAKIRQGAEIWKPDALFLKFLEAIRANFKHKSSVRQIAASLNSTEAKLNELSKLHTGRTAQNVMHGLTASEAKRLFMYERLSVKEVAYELGFNDPFYFSNFFKKQTRQSPKAYREKYSI